jgi:hypothetical protein
MPGPCAARTGVRGGACACRRLQTPPLTLADQMAFLKNHLPKRKPRFN